MLRPMFTHFFYCALLWVFFSRRDEIMTRVYNGWMARWVCGVSEYESVNSKQSAEHHTHIIHFKWNIKWKWIVPWERKINTKHADMQEQKKKQRNQRGQKIELIAHLFGDAAGIFAIVCIWQIMRIEHVSLCSTYYYYTSYGLLWKI